MKLIQAVRPRLAGASCRACTAKASFVQSRCFSDGSNDGSSDGSSSPGAVESEPSTRKQGPWLANKRAIITGGSRGIGQAIASRLAYSGAQCTLVGRDEWALQSAVKSLASWDNDAVHKSASSFSGEHSYAVGDVRDENLWSELFEDTPDVNILVNAAGVSQSSFLSRTSPEEIRNVLDTNLYGAILGSRAALIEWMGNRRRDRIIINISSLLALRGGIGASAYAASKAGLIGLTRALADEGKSRGFRANVIVPGYIESDMTETLREPHRSRLISRIPAGRFGRPSEVADAAFFLINNKYANNCVLNLDGGLSALG